MNIYFWQQIVTPHMAGLAAALAERGHSVTYVANAAMSQDRASQGWKSGDVGRARLTIASTLIDISEVVAAAPADAVHIIEGLRGNGLTGVAQRALRRRGVRIWVVHEKIDDRGLRGFLRRAAYHWAYRDALSWVERLLAIGDGTDSWAAKRGFPQARIAPFTYFLPSSQFGGDGSNRPFTFCFAGQLIERKRVDLLIDAFAEVRDPQSRLEIVGDGPLCELLRDQANAKLSNGDVLWRGALAIDHARALIAEADCLILPSDHDGWGAVASEALIAGSRVICSSACGSAAAVKEDPNSHVFMVGNVSALEGAIKKSLALGKVSLQERLERRKWALSLTAPAGAAYLESLLAGRAAPSPWSRHHS